MKRRSLFSGSADFVLYDLFVHERAVNENVFVYSNQHGNDRSLIIYNNSFAQTTGLIHQSATDVPKRRLLAEVLGLHFSPKHFVLFWEQRSNQWFIRSSKEMYERGLFAALNGYQAQVFLNIHEVEDGETGRWAKIHYELEGKGCADIYAALQDMLLKELYDPFAEFLCKKNIDLLHKIVVGEDLKTDAEKNNSSVKTKAKKTKPLDRQTLIDQYINSVKEPIIRFIRTAGIFLDGASGRYDPFVSENSSESIDAKLIWEHAEKYLQRLINFESLLSNAKIKKDKMSAAFIANLITTMRVKPEVVAYATGYGICTILRDILGETGNGREAKLLIDHWHLDRKFRETYQGLNIRGDEAWRVVELFKGLLKRTAPVEYMQQTPKALAKTLAEEALESSEYKDILGLNQFDNAIWFNKECFDDTLFYISLFVTLEHSDTFKVADTKAKGKKTVSKKAVVPEEKNDSEAVWFKRIKATAEIVKLFQAAEEKAGYKLEELQDGFGE
jgi:hypothetical protein